MNAPTKLADRTSAYRVVGTRPVRPDGVDKVTGRAIYGPDFTIANMIHGAVLRSPHAHARIRSIDTSRAVALPGVKAVVTGADFPSLESLTMVLGESAANQIDISHGCMARDLALFEGHAVAAVAAISEDVARAALDLIAVDYEVLPHVLDLEAAMATDAPLVGGGVMTSGLDSPATAPSNVVSRLVSARGDVEAALAGASVLVSARYSCATVHQGYIEPQACVAHWGADGQAQIWASSQGHFMIRQLTASVLGLRQADIRVVPLEIGGGFGGKTTVYLEPVAMLLSRKAGRPVRLALSREEVFRSTGPAPGGIMEVTVGARADGTLVGLDMEFWYVEGAFPGNDVQAGVMSALAAYRLEDSRVTGWNVLTNMPSTHAYRAPGAPQVVFAVEAAIDELAQKLGIDPLELRLKNAARPGDRSPSGTPNGRIGLVECLEAVKAHPHWSAPLASGQGRGLAMGGWGNYGGPSTANVSLGEDGTVLVRTGSPDIGGSRASMAMMAAEVLGVAYDTVRPIVADTASIGYTMLTGGSRTTFATGKAVVAAAGQVRDICRERAALIWGVEAGSVEWREGAAHCTAGESAGQAMSLRQIAAKAAFSGGPIGAEVGLNAAGWLPGFAVHICDAELDRETGQVTITRYTAVQDVGTAIHPDYVEGQLQGGAVQGIGWALNEAYVWDGEGRLENPGFLDYRMPVASDLPMIDTVLVEVPNPAHPYGVKGVGEAPIVPPLAAVCNAVSRAAGKRFHDLPLRPDRVWAELNA